MKQKVLAPIEHRDAYNVPAQRELNAWLREAIFDPLFAVLAANGISRDPERQAIRFDEFGRNNSAEARVPFPSDWRPVGLHRRDLPQIPEDERGVFVTLAYTHGIGSYATREPADWIRPAQADYDPAKLREHNPEEVREIFVDENGIIFDGHHQWTSDRLSSRDAQARVRHFGAGLTELILLAQSMPGTYRANAAGALEEALESGRIHYADGVFSGRFSAATTRELKAIGAKWDPQQKAFRLSADKIPPTLRVAVADSAARSAAATEGVLRALDEAVRNISVAESGLRLTRAVDAVLADAGQQLASSVATVTSEGIAVQAQVTERVRAELTRGYTENLELGIKGFAKERIPELRRRVEDNALAFGGRTDRLAKIIEAEFGVAKRKAEFLADQETGLLVSKYRVAKYEEAGITEYLWSTSRDNRVRKTHRDLQGKKFSFATKANVSAPGQAARYCNPGEDYRCRCVPRPVINLAEIAA